MCVYVCELIVLCVIITINYQTTTHTILNLTRTFCASYTKNQTFKKFNHSFKNSFNCFKCILKFVNGDFGKINRLTDTSTHKNRNN